jgi:hypothetical protein
MEYLDQIAKQGLGYLLFAGSLVIIFYQNRKIDQYQNEKVELANRRVEDLKDARNAYAAVSDASTKVAENTYTIVQNLQQLLNNLKV